MSGPSGKGSLEARIRANKRWRKKNAEKLAIYRSRENAKRRKKVPRVKLEYSFLHGSKT